MIKISPDNLSDGEIITLLNLHRQEMLKHSPLESVHALDEKALTLGSLSFWRADFKGNFAACGAIKHLSSSHAELKSMKTIDAFLRKGIARTLLLALIQEAKNRGYEKLSLETGTMAVFIPARTLYKSVGFVECAPFGEYFQDVNSVCMSLKL